MKWRALRNRHTGRWRFDNKEGRSDPAEWQEFILEAENYDKASRKAYRMFAATRTEPAMKDEKPLVKLELAGYPITITQVPRTKNQYVVQYGLQITTHHDWQDAAHAFGYCVFHALECEGKITRSQ